jgi:hypothetical protein
MTPNSLARALTLLAILTLAACSKEPKEPASEQSTPPGQAITVEQRAHHIAGTIRASASTSRRPMPMQPLARVPLDQSIAQQRQAARDGDIQAARTLGERLLRCRRSLRENPLASLLQRYEWDMAEIDSGDPAIKEFRRRNIESQFLSAVETHEDCIHAQQVPMAEAVQWLQRAGMAGDTQAQLAYARYALEEFPDRAALIRNPAAAKQRAGLARTWTEQLVEAGNEDALEFMSTALSGSSPLYAKDREKSYIYGRVLSLIRAKRGDRSPYAKTRNAFDRLWNGTDLQHDRQLTPAQVENINRRARELYLAHFSTASP